MCFGPKMVEGTSTGPGKAVEFSGTCRWNFQVHVGRVWYFETVPLPQHRIWRSIHIMSFFSPDEQTCIKMTFHKTNCTCANFVWSIYQCLYPPSRNCSWTDTLSLHHQSKSWRTCLSNLIGDDFCEAAWMFSLAVLAISTEFISCHHWEIRQVQRHWWLLSLQI